MRYATLRAPGSASRDAVSPLSHSLSAEKEFLRRCSAGATGDGWEFMAYRSGWRLLGARKLRAYFAELYGSSPTDIDSREGMAADDPRLGAVQRGLNACTRR